MTATTPPETATAPVTPPAATGISQALFARQRGYVKSYVTALKKAGRLVLAADGKVDAPASVERIAATADPNRDDVARRHQQARQITPTAAPEPQDAAASPTAKAAAPEAPAEAILSYQVARALKENYAARNARLEYNRAAGLLIERAAVSEAIEDIVITLRQAIEQQPHRLAPELVGQDLDTIRRTLKRETAAMLTDLSKNFRTQLQQLSGQDAGAPTAS